MTHTQPTVFLLIFRLCIPPWECCVTSCLVVGFMLLRSQGNVLYNGQTSGACLCSSSQEAEAEGLLARAQKFKAPLSNTVNPILNKQIS